MNRREEALRLVEGGALVTDDDPRPPHPALCVLAALGLFLVAIFLIPASCAGPTTPPPASSGLYIDETGNR